MSFNSTPYKSRPPPGQLGSTPFRSSSASKFRSSLVPTSRPSPARTPNPLPKPSKISNGARDLFRTSTPRTQRTTEFAPDLPAEATRLPASVRKFAPRKSVSSGMSNTASTEPFTMRIPSPDPDLTGQIVAQSVPDDPKRTGSVYADQFLARKCPSHFDELQRRQFFCILDLRRLKYAADEIFAKKDWKLNILNFAKEYEKSRGLIMLRYGLYEFKNVKPSSEVLKKWRAAHGLPSEPEEDQFSSPNRQRAGAAASTKRKAEEDLMPRDTTLMTSNANQNKRRNLAQEVDDPILAGPAPFKKTKRKADETEEADENKPNKQQKSTPSAATSLFANIINKPPNGGTSPSKPTSQTSTLFGISKSKNSEDSSFATKANPFQPTHSSLFPSPAKTNNVGTPSGSVFAAPNIGSAPITNTGNIFSYVPESSPSSSGDEDGNADDNETDSEPEPDSEEQGPSAAISTGTSTPPVQNGPSLFGASKTSNNTNIFGELSKSADQTTKGGLFGRVQIGANGQPVRANSGPDERQEGSLNQPWAADKQQTKTPAKGPGDYTFNPATTPISFGQPTSAVSKSSSSTDLQPSVESDSSEAKKPASIFGMSGQASSGLKPNTSSVFAPSGSTKPQSSEASVSIFAPQKPASASTSIFGATSTTSAAKSPSGGDEQTNEASVITKKQAVSVFDKLATSTFATSETKSLNSNVEDKVASSIPKTKDQAPSIFDKSFIATSAAQVKALSSSFETSSDLFNRNSNPLFGAAKDEKATSSVPPAKDQAPSIFDKSFIATSAAQVKALSNGSKSSSDLFSRSSNPLFGAEKANGTTLDSTKSIFGQPEKQASPDTTSNTGTLQMPNDENKENTGSVLGLKALASPTPATSIFGTQAASNSAAPSSALFGEKKPEEPTKPASSIFGSTSTANSPIFSFGSQPSSNSNTQSTSMAFGAGAGAGATPTPSVSFGALNSQPNGGGPNKVGFQFGNSAPSATSTPFTFGQSSAFGQSSSSGSGFSFTAGADKKVNNPFGSDKQTVNNPFAASQPGSQLSAPTLGGNSFTATPSSSFTFSFGQQPSSTPTAAPSSQGGGIFGGSAKTNGALGFNFTQASPGQGSQNSLDSKFPKAPALMNPSSHLQASGDGSTRANSPFPAPSSMGTTPVNGTPEPQAPHEDGQEAPQEQISLTEGGPGEEDETILHEVRAKAIKYIPVQQGDEDEGKSPWSTRGVGPLRVLQNKSTGAVRVLLRAEPRGHIALNKAILPDVEYKSKAKTVNFVAADDNGSGLETWMLQVKKPESAIKLAEVLEANKIANKK
ncbi:hypothetical protein E0Z10_g7292 [Xylaria hypoxylon]|uniref:RanBD1 domain-containing protein n=1 Tax=Xylaria hypoxylon TaxID=37992 RepID=A0A4Z0YEA3_9PEZI|nr:hypothetical protein E0Z10_g7292 [Xylaria hypoxylon]